MTNLKKVLLLVIALLAFPWSAYAYIDPGAGSMLLQLLLGGVAGLFVFFRIFKQKFLKLLGLRKDNDDK